MFALPRTGVVLLAATLLTAACVPGSPPPPEPSGQIDVAPIVFPDGTDALGLDPLLNERGEAVVSPDGTSNVFVWRDGETRRINPDGVPTYAHAISDKGKVVGQTRHPVRPFSWVDGQWKILPIGDASQGRAINVNERGTILGSLDGELVVWKGEEIVRPPEGPEDVNLALASPGAINNRNQVLFHTYVDGNPGAGLWDVETGDVTMLGTLGGDQTNAAALNDRGMVVGWSITADQDGPSVGDPGCDFIEWSRDRCGAAGKQHAFLWHDGEMVDLGTLGGDRSGAIDLNEWGQVVGSSEDAEGEMHNFVWYQGEMTATDPPGTTSGATISSPVVINNWGQVVGQQGEYPFHAYLWQNGRTVNLGELAEPAMLSSPVGINDRGQVLGLAHAPGSGPRYGFLWTLSPRWGYHDDI